MEGNVVCGIALIIIVIGNLIGLGACALPSAPTGLGIGLAINSMFAALGAYRLFYTANKIRED